MQGIEAHEDPAGHLQFAPRQPADEQLQLRTMEAVGIVEDHQRSGADLTVSVPEGDFFDYIKGPVAGCGVGVDLASGLFPAG